MKRYAIGRRFASLLAEHIRRRRKGKVGRRWYVDETYLRVKGKRCYLYRAIDREGNLVDSMLSATRDRNAAQRFFRSAPFIVNLVPKQVTTDGHDSIDERFEEHSVRRWSIAAVLTRTGESSATIGV